MDALKKPLFLVAVAALALAFLIELGSTLLPAPEVTRDQLEQAIETERRPGEPAPDLDAVLQARREHPPRPGLGIPYLALLDGLLLFAVFLMGASLLVPERIHGRIQGVATLVLTLVVFSLGLLLISAALTLLLLMVGLFFSAPFGTIAYLAIWGFFDRAGASGTLGLLLALKLAFGVCLALAHPRFLQNKGLVLLTITALVANVIVAFLHGVVPRVMASITDALAAIVVGILALIWAVVFFAGSLVSVLKVVRLARSRT